MEPKDDCELGDIANISVNKIFIGREGKEVVPRNIVDLAAFGSEDDRYSDLVKFFESERDWSKASEDIRSCKAGEYDISIEGFGGHKLLNYQGNRVIPPHSQRKQILVTIHSTHKSSDSTLCMARANFWWPHMSYDVKKMVESCAVSRVKNTKEYRGKRWGMKV